MVLYDHQATIVRILPLLCRTLNSGFLEEFQLQGQVQFHNCQIHRDDRELRKAQS